MVLPVLTRPNAVSVVVPILPAFFVATDGDDANDGQSVEAPFLTLEKARDEMRLDGTRSHTYLRGGRYELSAAIALTSSDNGTAYVAYPGETPIISGGELVSGGSFSDQGGGIWEAAVAGDVPNDDIVTLNGIYLDMCSGSDAWTRGDFTTGWHFADGGSSSELIYKGADFTDAEVTGDNLFFVGVTSIDQAGGLATIDSVDTGTKTITFSTVNGNTTAYQAGARFRILNNADEHLAGAPTNSFGWHSANNKIRVKPAVVSDLTTHGVVVGRLTKVFDLSSCDNVTFLGLTVSDCKGGANDDAAFKLTMATNIKIAYGIIKNVAVPVSAKTSSDGLRVIENDISFCNQTGVRIQNSDNWFVYGNKIEEIGKYQLVAEGTWGRDVLDGEISWNLIQFSPRYGTRIADGGSNINRRITIEYNRILDTMLESRDGGAINFLGRSGDQIDSLVRHNYIDRCRGLSTNDGTVWYYWMAAGVYLDDNTNDVDILDNFINRITFANVLIHGGQNCQILRNAGTIYSGRAKHSGGFWHDDFVRFQTSSPPQDMTGNTFLRNVVYAPSGITEGPGQWWSMSGGEDTDTPEVDHGLYKGEPQLILWTDAGTGEGGTGDPDGSSTLIADPNELLENFTTDGNGELEPDSDIGLTSFVLSHEDGPSVQMECFSKAGGPKHFGSNPAGYDVSTKFGPLPAIWNQFNP